MLCHIVEKTLNETASLGNNNERCKTPISARYMHIRAAVYRTLFPPLNPILSLLLCSPCCVVSDVK